MLIETHYSYETSFLTPNSYFDVNNNDNLFKFDAIFKYLFSFVFYCFFYFLLYLLFYFLCILLFWNTSSYFEKHMKAI